MTSIESRAIEKIANELKDDGYVVVIEPDSALIPFDLRGYRPDLLATRDGENLLVEVKTRNHSRSLERYREIAAIVSQQKNWRFLLSTVGEDTPNSTVLDGAIEVDALARLMKQLDPLLDGESYILAVPYLWHVYIAGMRAAGRGAGVPIDATSDSSVLNYMYSLGEISNEDLRRSRELLNLRNEVAHGVTSTTISRNDTLALRDFVKKKLADWGLLSSADAIPQ